MRLLTLELCRSEMSGAGGTVGARPYLWLIIKVKAHFDLFLVIGITADIIQRGKFVFGKLVCLLCVLIRTGRVERGMVMEAVVLTQPQSVIKREPQRNLDVTLSM